MTISTPSNFSFQSSNVTDSIVTLKQLMVNCQAPVFDPKLEIQSNDWVYEYNDDVVYTPKIWSQTDQDNGVYQVGEIVFENCKLYKVTGKSGTGITYHQRPKEPNEYSAFDNDMDYSNWSERYIKVSSKTACSWLEKVWTEGNRQYYMQWDDAKDAHNWVVRDRDNCGCHSSKINRTDKYDSSNDVKSAIVSWSGPGGTRSNTVVIKSMVERDDYYYLRTNINAKLEYHNWQTGTAFNYSWMEVLSPSDIDGFIQKRKINQLQPFDGKNYTKTLFETSPAEGYASWDLVATEDFDSVAFGRVLCDSISVRITDQEGALLFELNNYEVDNTIDPSSNQEFHSTVVLYTANTIQMGSVIHIEINGNYIEIGEIVPALKLDAGFTNLVFKNKFKDFSPKEQDQWGNWYYNDGVRVHVHSGTVDLPIIRYDQLTRLMIYVGGRKVIINSSDSTNNEIPDSRTIFQSTMMIARFTTFELATQAKDKRLCDVATYNFALEELV